MAQVTGRKKIPLFHLASTDDMGNRESQPSDLWSEAPETEWEDPTFQEVVRRQGFRDNALGTQVPWHVLTDKQRFVLRASWGMEGGPGNSFHEIGELMGVTGAAVNRIYGRAMGTLRKEMGG